MKRNNLYVITMTVLLVIIIGIVCINSVELGLSEPKTIEEQ